MIEFKNVSKLYKEKAALRNINMTIACGEFFVLVGTSGSGKTTTLKMINRLLTPTEGTVSINGVDVQQSELRELRLNIGYVLQAGALFPNLTVCENIEIIPEMKGWPKEERVKTIHSYLEMVGLPPDQYMNRYPHELSGGEQQMVAVARALIGMPKLLILDEPSLGLAPNIVDDILEVAKTMVKNDGISVLLVEQDITKALAAADRGYVIENGRVALEGTAAELSANEHVKKAYLGI